MPASVSFGILTGYFWGIPVQADITEVSPESVAFFTAGLKAYEQALQR
jgi:hypothetical protein